MGKLDYQSSWWFGEESPFIELSTKWAELAQLALIPQIPRNEEFQFRGSCLEFSELVLQNWIHDKSVCIDYPHTRPFESRIVPTKKQYKICLPHSWLMPSDFRYMQTSPHICFGCLGSFNTKRTVAIFTCPKRFPQHQHILRWFTAVHLPLSYAHILICDNRNDYMDDSNAIVNWLSGVFHRFLSPSQRLRLFSFVEQILWWNLFLL